MSDIKEEIKANGFCIYKSSWVIDYKQKIKDELLEVAKRSTKKINKDIYQKAYRNENLTDFLNVCHKYENENEITRRCYEIFPAQPGILSLVNNLDILDLVKCSGISYPFPGTTPLVRIDRPRFDHFLTPPHQDFWFSMLCENSLVLWYTLDEISEDMGFLKVVPGSHNEGLIPFRLYEEGHEPFVPIKEFLDDQYIDVETAADEILVFNQKLVHKSGINRSNKLRLSMQLRFNDLDTAKDVTSTFVANHSNYVLRKQKEELGKTGS